MKKLLALVFSMLLYCSALQAEQLVGKVVIAKGDVSLTRSSDNSVIKPKPGEKLYLNDHVKTGKSGFAKLLLSDKSILKISPSSDVKISTQILDKKNGNTTIDLLKGKLRSVVVNKLQAKSKYEIKTSVAVAGVRGTDFEVVAGTNTKVHCYEGVVSVRNINEHIKGTVLLRPNTFTSVEKQGVPEKPQQFIPTPGGQAKQGKSTEEELAEAEVSELEEKEDSLIEDQDISVSDLQDQEGLSQNVIDEPINGDPTDGRAELQVNSKARNVNISIDIPAP